MNKHDTVAKPSEDTKLEILNDHYKDSFVHLQEHRKFRDRSFILVVVFVGLLLFQLYAPKESGQTFGEFVAAKFELKTSVDISFLGSLIWFGLLGVLIRYFQTGILLERQYKYIHSLEDQLSSYYDGKTFTRESKAYLKNYPRFSDVAHLIYTVLFPFLLIVVVIAKIWNEISVATQISALLVFDVAACVCIIATTFLYLRYIHWGK